MKTPQSGALIYNQRGDNVNQEDFRVTALSLFSYQYVHNPLYRRYCDVLNIDPSRVQDLADIPFLPISFFRTHVVLAGGFAEAQADLVFESSGTTGEQTSRHFVVDKSIYEESLLHGFAQFYGHPAQYAILALLPSYLERPHASLVYMAKTLMAASGHAASGFYVDEWDALVQRLHELERAGTKALLLGVTFALLDFSEKYPMVLRNTIVMETGGMKGRRRELTRDEVHGLLKERWGLSSVHSEYGMTELLSQAYSKADGVFSPTPTMRVLVRDINDPADVKQTGAGALNVIDLANRFSCAFVATDDIGNVHANGTFTVLGRLDNSILRGCSQMVV